MACFRPDRFLSMAAKAFPEGCSDAAGTGFGTMGRRLGFLLASRSGLAGDAATGFGGGVTGGTLSGLG